MGTDIHGVWQKYDAAVNGWQDVESQYKQDRHYQLFAVLADVRNGYGFAGVPTGDRVLPIAFPRGLPEDFPVSENTHCVEKLEYIKPCMRKYGHSNEDMYVWMGDHSHSWLTGEEILRWVKYAPTVVKVGVLSRAAYEAWDKTGAPEAYYGSISGSGVLVVEEHERHAFPEHTHIRCLWKQNLAEELKYFIDEVRRLVELHGEIRFVFGFDS